MMNLTERSPATPRKQRKAAMPDRQDSRVIPVSVEDMTKIIEQMKNPPKPTDALLSLFLHVNSIP